MKKENSCSSKDGLGRRNVKVEVSTLCGCKLRRTGRDAKRSDVVVVWKALEHLLLHLVGRRWTLLCLRHGDEYGGGGRERERKGRRQQRGSLGTGKDVAGLLKSRTGSATASLAASPCECISLIDCWHNRAESRSVSSNCGWREQPQARRRAREREREVKRASLGPLFPLPCDLPLERDASVEGQLLTRSGKASSSTGTTLRKKRQAQAALTG